MTSLYNSLPQEVRRAASGYREFLGTETFYSTRDEAFAKARELADETGHGTIFSPEVLVEFPNGEKLILGVPISDHQKADVIYDACEKSGAFKNVSVVWEVHFLA